MSFVKRLLANPSCSFKLYIDTQIIENSFQNYTTIISISQVKKIRFSIIDHIRNTYERSGSFHTLTEERGILLNYVHRCQAEKWNEIGKYTTKMKNIKGSFPLGSYNLFLGPSVWIATQKVFSFSCFKTIFLLVAPPGRWGHILTQESG